MEPSPSLSQLLVNTLPPGFVRVFPKKLADVYSESYQTVFNNPNLNKEDATYLLGHKRRALAETVFYRTAVEHGLKASHVQPENGGCAHVSVEIGQFCLAMCHVQTRGAFPKHSDNREQASQINRNLPQLDLFPDIFPDKKDDFFGILVHTEYPGNKDQFQSVSIGFPNTNFNNWVDEPIDLLDIQNLQEQAFQSKSDPHILNQNDSPTFKTKIIQKHQG